MKLTAGSCAQKVGNPEKRKKAAFFNIASALVAIYVGCGSPPSNSRRTHSAVQTAVHALGAGQNGRVEQCRPSHI